MNPNGLPLISDIRSFALDDGPGIRTTVFVKGCPLSCLWCHNPETISPKAEMSFNIHRCIACGDCLRACRHDAIDLELDGRIRRERCTACGNCAEVCPTLAIKRIGIALSPDQLAERLLLDKPFYDTSGGGVTFSGGEPTLYMDYVSAVIGILRKHNISVALQTAGLFDMAQFQAKLLGQVDWIYFDLKLFDAEKHRQYTAANNGIILSNFLELTRKDRGRVIPRLPLVAGITDTRGNLEAIARFLRRAGYDRLELLAYHGGGIEKLRRLGKPVPQQLSAWSADPRTEALSRRIVDEAMSGDADSEKGKRAAPALSL